MRLSVYLLENLFFLCQDCSLENKQWARTATTLCVFRQLRIRILAFVSMNVPTVFTSCVRIDQRSVIRHMSERIDGATIRTSADYLCFYKVLFEVN